MATITPARIDAAMSRAFITEWAAIPANSDGEPKAGAQHAGQFSDKSVQVSGAFDGATVTIEGTNNGTTWEILTDAQGNPLSFTSNGLAIVAEATWKIRPVVSGGGVSTAINVHVLMKEV